MQGIVSSYDSSFKMANAGPIIGTLRQDLRSGISGRLGPTPPMLPARITLDGPDGRREYRYRIARGVLLEPTLLGWAATNSFLHQGWRTGEAAMDGTLTIHYNGGRTLVRRDRLASRLPSSEIAGVLLAPVPLLLTNPFEPVTLDSVSLDVSYAPKLAESILVDLWAERAEVRPGETLSLTARLQDRQGTRREIPVEIQVPERWRGKSLLIVAGGARDLTEWDQDRSPSIYEPKDLAGLERLIREYPDAGDLLVRIYGEEDGVVLGDLEMGPLPGSIESVLGSAHKRGPARPSTNYRIEERRIDAASVVTGGLGVRVRVEP
ncbi:MAG: hypothetical protein QUU85_15625 [Candidatus Eisenbacteria bacterium]|nr:hypothetical protein [Candidatus Eisenbacteria bacterium]